MRPYLLAALLSVTVATPSVVAAKPAPHAGHDMIQMAVADPQRSAANRARDKYRHPVETLKFFGVTPTQTVVEFNPSGGWYTEILAPMLKDKGRYIALAGASEKAQTSGAKLLADHKAWFGPATLASIDPKTGTSSVAPGSADVVLTFRNAHNLIMAGGDVPANAFKAFNTMLKPGGVLGVVDHRLPEARDNAMEKTSGYIKRSTIVKLATAAGFKLVGESQINANPKDKADYPEGVWTLPPVLTKGDVDRAKYVAIGESDRMTLKFVKVK